MPVADRPFGPVSPAANSTTAPALNTQAAPGSALPLSQAVVSAAEVKLLAGAIALSVALPPDTGNEQTVLDLFISGTIKTTAAGTLAIGLYADAATAITAGNLLHKTAAAVTQNTTTAPFFFHARLIYDSVSGKLQGMGGGMINNVIDPEIAFTNVPLLVSNGANPVASFSVTLTSSGALVATPTTITIQKFSVG